MAAVAIIPAEIEHARYLAPRMREADRLEALAATGREPFDAVRMSLALSLEAWSGTVDGEVVCMFGVAAYSIVGGIGCPWLLGSDLVERNAFAFARRNRGMVRGWLRTWPILRNHVDARHAVALRWLRWVGFTLSPVEPYGPRGLPFHPFEMRAA